MLQLNKKLIGGVFVNDSGSFTAEAAIVVPLFILFIVFLLLININVFGETKAICEKDCTIITENSEVNRAAGVIFETGGELYDLFFS
jgi:hypothetical protein